MSSRSKQAGTATESAVVKWARAHGFPQARREVLHGSSDQGDVMLCDTPKVIVEVKHRRTSNGNAAVGQPGEKELDGWLRETHAEMLNSKATYGLLVVKRSRTTDVGQWWCYMRIIDFAALHADVMAPRQALGFSAWICMPFSVAVTEIRITQGRGMIA